MKQKIKGKIKGGEGKPHFFPIKNLLKKNLEKHIPGFGKMVAEPYLARVLVDRITHLKRKPRHPLSITEHFQIKLTFFC